MKATDNLRSRIRRALAGVELAQGEEPEILNYHGLAAQVIDRYGILAGIETGRRVLSQAQRVTLAGRVLDEMTFEHVKTEWQPSVVDKILNLDGQIANHLVDPDDVVAVSSRGGCRCSRRSRAPTASTTRRSSASSSRRRWECSAG